MNLLFKDYSTQSEYDHVIEIAIKIKTANKSIIESSVVAAQSHLWLTCRRASMEDFLELDE